MTFNVMTFNQITLSIATNNIMTLRIIIVSKMTVRTMTVIMFSLRIRQLSAVKNQLRLPECKLDVSQGTLTEEEGSVRLASLY